MVGARRIAVVLCACACGSGAQPDAAPLADGPVPSGDAGDCVDECPAPAGGVSDGCRKRFAYGINYAWHDFGGDFGGVALWGVPGVAANPTVYDAELAGMKARGVSLVRWWMFPDLRGDGVTRDASDTPTGLGGSTLADLDAALAAAEAHDLHLMLCLFSFDAFRPSQDVAGIWTPGLRPILRDPAKRQALLDLVVRPIAERAEASPHRDRLFAWDVINEPEWAVTGPSPYGDMDYDPNPELEPVSHQEMEDFIADVAVVLRAHSSAQITVGAAAVKWARAWQNVDLDFYQFHMYEWVNAYWPYTDPPSAHGLDDKPVVMGEFPLGPLTPADPYLTVAESWYQNGYAGALGWQYIEATPAQLGDVEAFAAAHPCDTQLGR